MFLQGLLLASALSIPAADAARPSRQLDVNCDAPGALQRALNLARGLRQADLFLHGVCTGHFVISTPGIALRAATPGSGLAAPANDLSREPVLEVDDVPVYLNGLIVQGGFVGLHVHGWKGDATLSGVEVFGQSDVGVYASEGGRASLFDSTVRDGSTGVAASFGAFISLQGVAVHDLYQGVVAFEKSTAALTDCTIERNSFVGVLSSNRSDVNMGGGALRENAAGHLAANDFSTISLNSAVVVGSEGDSTAWAMSVARHSRISSYRSPAIYGNVSAIDSGTLGLGETTLHGDLLVSVFSNAAVRDALILGVVACGDGAEAICRRTTTQGNQSCPSPSCGSAPGPAVRSVLLDQQQPPAMQAPSLGWMQRRESGGGGAERR